MADDPVEADAPVAPAPAPRGKRRLFPLAVLLAGGLLLAYLTSAGPREQHLRLVLGDAAPTVTALAVQYATADGEPLRDARMTYEPGAAPRIVSLEPRLADGAYRLRIEVDTREGRRQAERQVTLGGGTTSVDLAGVIGDKRTTP